MKTTWNFTMAEAYNQLERRVYHNKINLILKQNPNPYA